VLPSEQQQLEQHARSGSGTLGFGRKGNKPSKPEPIERETGILIAPSNSTGNSAKAPEFEYLLESPLQFTNQPGLIVCTVYASKLDTPEQYSTASSMGQVVQQMKAAGVDLYPAVQSLADTDPLGLGSASASSSSIGADSASTAAAAAAAPAAAAASSSSSGGAGVSHSSFHILWQRGPDTPAQIKCDTIAVILLSSLWEAGAASSSTGTAADAGSTGEEDPTRPLRDLYAEVRRQLLRLKPKALTTVALGASNRFSVEVVAQASCGLCVLRYVCNMILWLFLVAACSLHITFETQCS
jgi:hypothetical protein